LMIGAREKLIECITLPLCYTLNRFFREKFFCCASFKIELHTLFNNSGRDEVGCFRTLMIVQFHSLFSER
ncbi:hypothetical protein L9F63_013699, partial [Diploptera punctata]